MTITIQDSDVSSLPVGKKTLGIDFGTTFCCVASCDDDGVPQVLGPLIPSCIVYDGDTVFTGVQCAHRDDALRSIKGLMDPAGAYRVRHDGPWHGRSPFDGAVDLFQAIRRQSVDVLGTFVPHAVVTVPAYFDEKKRHTIKQAATKAGFHVLRLISEPTAAALCYRVPQDGVYGVYDLGGGTFDFSVVKMRNHLCRVLASGGHPSLGGDTIDRWIADRLFPHADNGLVQGRSVKENAGQTQIDLTPIMDQIATDTLAICAATLRDAGLSVQDLDGVVMVGGSTKMTSLVSRVGRVFPTLIQNDMDPDRSIAKGAALYGAYLTTQSPFLLMDVTPLSLGVETRGGIVERIIDRNSPLPHTKEMTFTTGEQGQTGMTIHVVQGEGELAKNCHSLGSFTLKNLSNTRKGGVKVRIVFALDVDGLLTVSACEEGQDNQESMVVNPLHHLRPDTVTAQTNQQGDDLWDRMWIDKVQKVTDALTEIRRLLKDAPCATLDAECDAIEALCHGHDLNALDTQWHKLSALALPLFEQSLVASLNKENRS